MHMVLVMVVVVMANLFHVVSSATILDNGLLVFLLLRCESTFSQTQQRSRLDTYPAPPIA